MERFTRGQRNREMSAAERYKQLWKISGQGEKVYLIEGHGRYPLYVTENSPKRYTLRRPLQKVPEGKAIIYMAEAGKCMMIMLGKQVTGTYFTSPAGIKEYLTGVAEKEGVYHTDVSAKSFLPSDPGYHDSTVNLSPSKNQPTFGFIWRLPLRFNPTILNLKANRSPTRGEVLNVRTDLFIKKRQEMWISEIVNNGPPGVYVVFSCLDIGPIPPAYNFPNIKPNYFAPAATSPEKVHEKRGKKVRAAVRAIFKRPALFKRKTLKKTVAKGQQLSYRSKGAGPWNAATHSIFPHNVGRPHNNIISNIELQNKASIAKHKTATPKVKVSEALTMLQKNSNMNVNNIKNLPARSSVLRTLKATQKGLSLLRHYPSYFYAQSPSRWVKLKVKLFPKKAAETIHTAVTRNPKFAKWVGGSPNTPNTSPK